MKSFVESGVINACKLPGNCECDMIGRDSFV